MRWCATAVIGLLIVQSQLAAAAEARVELELATSPSFPAIAQQQWYQLLTELGVSGLRIRQAAAEDRAEVKTAGTKAAPIYRVVGVLSARGELQVPGGRFSLRDRGRIASWLAKLKAEGPAALTGDAPRSPFGLSAEQFAAASGDLAQGVAAGSKGRTPAELLDKLQPMFKHAISVDPSLRQRLSRAEPIDEELAGLSSGTALAYGIRREGLGLVPRIGAGKKLEFAIIKPEPKQMTWPVGWPLEDRKPKDVVPRLFETLNAEIDDIPLTETLEVIAGRLEVVVLYDRYAMARQGIELEKLTAKFPPRKSWYAKIIDKILHQSGLKAEWRVDDAGKPLMWVTTWKAIK